MITCKEDLINTYIENDGGELLELYLSELRKYGLHNSEDGDYKYKYAASFVVVSSLMVAQEVDAECLIKDLKKLTLSDLKSRTKEVYEKVECSIFDLKGEFENGELYRIYATHVDPMYGVIETEFTLIQAVDRGNVYRKVTKPVEWWEEAAEYITDVDSNFLSANRNSENDKLEVNVAMTRDQWCDFARILLEQGE